MKIIFIFNVITYLGNEEAYDLEALLCIFTLCTLIAHRKFGKIELYTNSYNRMFIDKLKIPFDRVHEILEDFEKSQKEDHSTEMIKSHILDKEPYILFENNWWIQIYNFLFLNKEKEGAKNRLKDLIMESSPEHYEKIFWAIDAIKWTQKYNNILLRNLK